VQAAKNIRVGHLDRNGFGAREIPPAASPGRVSGAYRTFFQATGAAPDALPVVRGSSGERGVIAADAILGEKGFRWLASRWLKDGFFLNRRVLAV
jgi:hypothetical protein